MVSDIPEELRPVLHAVPFFVTAQLFTSDELQEMTEISPELTRVGFAFMVTFGERTVTDT